ncbi:MAG: MogA/MoaB family molybdenum cofactor biosynthesis protein [Phycisphaerae bacterium]|nr:MogA/MoaB family molybdenum cofactor biosynthesis protein [Phycisphaerae bacterium]
MESERVTKGDAIRAAVLTISDRCSRGETPDLSGPVLVARLRDGLAAVVVATMCVPDETERIRERVGAWSRADASIDLIVTTGGTGFAPRDVTPEAVRTLLEREAPGLMELARHRCLAKTPLTFLSRGVAGTIGQTLVITLPGSPRGATEQFDAIIDVLPHAISTLRDLHTDGIHQGA